MQASAQAIAESPHFSNLRSLEIGYNDIDPGPEYDRKTRNAIAQIQRQYGLTIDGVVGSMTKIVLYKEKKSLVIPSLEKTGIIFKGGLE